MEQKVFSSLQIISSTSRLTTDQATELQMILRLSMRLLTLVDVVAMDVHHLLLVLQWCISHLART